jgi:pimeloyl-ACP methyl ester carboxylesterase
VHGGEYGATATFSWEHNLTQLSARGHVVAPDLVGYGETAKLVSFDDSREFRVQQLWATILADDLLPVVLVGNSSGASLCLEIASRHEEFDGVSGVIAVSGGGKNTPNAERDTLNGYDGSVGEMQKILSILFYDERWSTGAYLERRHQESLRPGAWESISAQKLKGPGGGSPPHSVPDYGRIRCPVLLVGGDDDLLKSPEEMEKLEASIPTSELRLFGRSRHCSQAEHADAFNDMAARFLDDLGGA